MEAGGQAREEEDLASTPPPGNFIDVLKGFVALWNLLGTFKCILKAMDYVVQMNKL